jgi:hypothetical protein
VCKQRSEDYISDVCNGVEQLQLIDDLVDSKEHWGSLMIWSNPRNTRVAGDLVDSKEHWESGVDR